jgi:predicted HTH transcriptional regulator
MSTSESSKDLQDQIDLLDREVKILQIALLQETKAGLTKALFGFKKASEKPKKDQSLEVVEDTSTPAVKILRFVRLNEPVSAKRIATALKLTQPHVSYHLGVGKRRKLYKRSGAGKNTVWSLHR